jgi:hypothetical protein
MLVMGALALQGLSYLLMSTVTAFPLFVAVFLAFSLSLNLFRISLDIEVLKTDGKTDTGRRIGLFQGGRFVGVLLGTAGSGLLLAAVDFRWALVGMGVSCLALTIPAAMLAPTPMEKAPLGQYRGDMMRKEVIGFCAWVVLFASHWGAEYTSYGLFLRNDLQLDMSGMGLYMCGEFAAIAAITLGLGKRLDGRLGIRPLAVAGLLMSGIGHVVMLLDPLWVSFLGRVVHGFGDGAVGLVLYVGLSRLFNVGRMGGNAGLVNMLLMGGMVVGALFYGPLGEAAGYGLPIGISGALLVVLAVPVFLAKPAGRQPRHGRGSG